MSKYHRWYAQIVARAADRSLNCYSEWHHIRPRALGGGDDDANLAQLTYREHFLVHWLLTKICTGADLRKMQFALHAMTLKINGERTTTGWQFEAAKRALRDLELDPVAEAAWMERFRERQKAKRLQKERRIFARKRADQDFLEALPDVIDKRSVNEIAGKFLSAYKRPKGFPHRSRYDQSLPREERLRLAAQDRLNRAPVVKREKIPKLVSTPFKRKRGVPKYAYEM